ncbi:hypothetical protein COU37_03505 [Candidatus Micrarchaeota archaeon CG10_big_fil_rev_8_21_14_0_10_45_29]|nr:MAG: hypothetical protein COU37_03505 [Candidatus Micrarchaeota archaeon CG10_big_fil_rev_8_21_14_0_10_45_29]
MDKKRKASPGEEIGTEEEFVAGAGTYVEGSAIHSALEGEISDEGRTLSVSRPNRVSQPGLGVKVIGRIENIIDPIAIVSIHEMEGESARFPITGVNFVLRASNIKKGYTRKIRDEYSIGDIIRAKIVEIKNGECQLATDEDDLGCLKAYSSSRKRCALHKTPTGLKCENDDKKENRKIASDYISVQNA